MKNLIRIFALVLMLSTVLCGCGSVSMEDLIVPTFEDDKSITMGIWGGSMTNWTEEQFSYLQDAGINLVVGSSEYITYTDYFFDMAQEYGVQIIPDSRKWDGEVPGYADHPAFAGYCVWDEPSSTDFEILAEKKQKWDSVMGDSMFFINLFPGWTGTALGGSFDSYVSSYLETIQPEVLCFDHYALMEDSYENTVVRDTFFSDMDICSYNARKYGVDFWFTLLSAGHLSYVTPNLEEFRWQMAVGQAYGAKGLVHYVYASHDPDYTAPIDWQYQTPTEVYEDMAAANAEVNAWDHIYMSYDWQGIAMIKGDNNEFSSISFQLCANAVSATENTGIKAIASGEDLLCGIFRDEDGNVAYMLTNATNPEDDLDTTVTLTLDKQYKGVLIIDKGTQSVQLLNKNATTIDIESSEGVFVIPLLAQ